MPMIRYECQKCKAKLTSLYTKAAEIQSEVKCNKCDGVAKRKLGGPAAASRMTMSNGQQKPVEIRPDIMERREEMTRKPPDRGD